MVVAAIHIEGVIAEMRADVLVGLHISCPLVLRNFNKKNKTSSVYDCTVEDVEYICNTLSLLLLLKMCIPEY